MWFKSPKARLNPRLELLKQQMKGFLGRDLTAKEEYLLQLSESILKNEEGGSVPGTDKNRSQAA